MHGLTQGNVEFIFPPECARICNPDKYSLALNVFPIKRFIVLWYFSNIGCVRISISEQYEKITSNFHRIRENY